MTQERNNTIDILRGIAIAGMILCANIGWHADLPAWMFHAQTPPPDYVFNPEVRGITWVDLVFPFFLFSMGAAFPFALGKRLDKGEKLWLVTGRSAIRWVSLVIFSYILGNAHSIPAPESGFRWDYLLKTGVWASLFLIFAKFPCIDKQKGLWLKAGGILLMSAIAFAVNSLPGADLSFAHRDIIILVLAYVSFLGGLIWILTRKSLTARWIVFAVVAAAKISGITAKLDFDFLQYLMIAIPGSIAGDLILSDRGAGKHGQSGKDEGKPAIFNTIAAIIALAAVVFQLWAFFTRHIILDMVVTAVCMTSFVLLSPKGSQKWSSLTITGFILLLGGILFDPIDGGIRKDYCNTSYLLATSGMAAITTGLLWFLEKTCNMKMKFIAKCGQNPMLAYTVTPFLILPVLYMTGLMPFLDSLTYGSPFFGVMRGVVVTLLMAIITVFFTDKKVFWKN